MKLYCADCMDILFLSTLSLRRATAPKHGVCRGGINFYPRSPCGERLSAFHSAQPDLRFLSTLSLRRATIRHELAALVAEFLSTLSLRRATKTAHRAGGNKDISIHALLAESDRMCHTADRVRAYISIHALLAESDQPCDNVKCNKTKFLSTLSLRRATMPTTLSR